MSDVTDTISVRHTKAFDSLWKGPASFIIVFYAVLYSVYAVVDKRALTADGFTDLVDNAVPLALAAAGQTLVVLSRGFDLSVVGSISLANVLMAVCPMEGPGGAFISLLMCMAVGGTVGVISGYLVAYRQLQSIAATLGVMIVAQGVALLILQAPGGTVADWVANVLTGTVLSYVPVAILLPIIVAIVWVIVQRTDFGSALYAIGADETAASLSGVATQRTRLLSYVFAGVLYGMAGFALSAQTGTGDPNSGTPFLLLSFSAVALGGTSLLGGRGGVVGSLIGAAALMLIQSVLLAAGVSSFYIGLCQGILLILSILLSRFIDRIAMRGELS